MSTKKIMYVSGPGGHFSEIERLFDIFPNIDKFIVTCRRQDTEAYQTSLRKYFIIAPYRNVFRLLINLFQSAMIVFSERPNIVITTGAGIGLFCCYLAKALGAKVTHVECSAQVDSPSMFGRLISPIVSKWCVQWETMMQFYPDAKLLRLLFSLDADIKNKLDVKEDGPGNPSNVFVTVGTTKEAFDRLIKAIDIVSEKHPDISFFVQYGSSSKPNINSAINFLSIQDFGRHIDKADVVITHGGVGCIASSIRRGKRVIVVPRLSKYAEHENDHQLQISTRIGELMGADIYLKNNKEYDLADWISAQLMCYSEKDHKINWMPDHEKELSNFCSEIVECVK